jgi:hypothetical protein
MMARPVPAHARELLAPARAALGGRGTGHRLPLRTSRPARPAVAPPVRAVPGELEQPARRVTADQQAADQQVRGRQARGRRAPDRTAGLAMMGAPGGPGRKRMGWASQPDGARAARERAMRNAAKQQPRARPLRGQAALSQVGAVLARRAPEVRAPRARPADHSKAPVRLDPADPADPADPGTAGPAPAGQARDGTRMSRGLVSAARPIWIPSAGPGQRTRAAEPTRASPRDTAHPMTPGGARPSVRPASGETVREALRDLTGDLVPAARGSGAPEAQAAREGEPRTRQGPACPGPVPPGPAAAQDTERGLLAPPALPARGARGMALRGRVPSSRVTPGLPGLMCPRTSRRTS